MLTNSHAYTWFAEREILMNERNTVLRRTSAMAAVLVLAVVSIAVVKTTGQEGAKASDTVANEQWEYLAVAGPSTTNLTPTGNPRMRKEPNVPFGREAFVLEQHLALRREDQRVDLGEV